MDVTGRTSGCGEDIAAYALGALPEEDARAFRAHLEECELCRADLATLQPVIDQLPGAVDAVDPPPALKKRVMAVVEAEARERRRAEQPERERWFDRVFVRHPVPAFAAAAVLLLAGIGVGVVATRDETATYTGSVVGSPSARAKLELKDGRGTLVVVGMPRPPEGRVWQVWTKHDGQAPQPTDALFRPSRDGRASVVVPGDMEGVDEVLVTHEPDGGSEAPTVAPSIDIPT